MFRNMMTVMFRNLVRQKGYSIINILGLALGVAATLLILMIVQFELSFESMHPAADRIYRINSETNMGGTANELGVTPAALAPSLREALPDLEGVVRVMDNGRMGIQYEDQTIYNENGSITVDPDYLKMFAIELESGDVQTALDLPNSVMLSERFAEKVFGEIPEVGSQIVLSDNEPYTVTAIYADPPKNTMFQADMLISFASLPEQVNQIWGSMGLVTFVQLTPDTDPLVVSDKAEALLKEQIGSALERLGITWEMSLFPLNDIHLHSSILGDPDSNVPMLYVIGFSAIAGFILLLACINFVNLSTARSARRSLEVGVRKVMGANRAGLIRQFLSESILYAFISVLLAVAIVLIALPEFRALIQRPVATSQLLSFPMLGGMIGIILVVGLISGAFPAFLLSAFRPIQVLKKGQSGVARGSMTRKVLVVGQFIVSIALIIGTITTYEQIRFLAKQDIGFQRDQILRLWPSRELDNAQLRAFNDAVKQLPGVESTTLSDSSPFGRSASKTVIDPDNAEEGQSINVWIYQVDPDFFDTYGMTITDGRGFDPKLATDNGGAVVLNETAALSVNWTGDVLEGRIPVSQERIAESSPFHDPDAPPPHSPEAEDYENEHLANIVGVVRDFTFMDFHRPIEPIMFLVNEDAASHVSVRIAPQNLIHTRDMIQETWDEYFPNEQVDLRFMDETISSLLESDRLFGNMIAAFSVLAVIIASLGLFGLVSHTAEARTKELGVRKVLGASEPSLVLLLTREFTSLVLIASLIAVPGAIWLMNKWLADFAYSIDIGVGIVMLSVLTSLLLAWLSVAYQAIRAARRNPVDSLRYE